MKKFLRTPFLMVNLLSGFEKITREAIARNRSILFWLLLFIMVTSTGACAAAASLALPDTAPVISPSAMPISQNQEGVGVPTEPVELIPATSLVNLPTTGCPDWDVTKMYEYGEYLYGFYCAGCHGRQGQGVPFTSRFPPLKDSTLAVSEDISYGLLYMMNTDIHPNASRLFEKDALSVINYIRITFAGNTDLICPGEYIIEINP